MIRILSLLSALTTVCILLFCLLGLTLIWLPDESRSEVLWHLLWSSIVLAIAGGFVIAVHDAVARIKLAAAKHFTAADTSATVRSDDRLA